LSLQAFIRNCPHSHTWHTRILSNYSLKKSNIQERQMSSHPDKSSTSDTSSGLPYRKNVAAFILNDEGKILSCKRADKFKDWQLPQGGIDEGETPVIAARRELKEEVGLRSAALLGSPPDPIAYTWPPELHQR